MLLLLIRWQLCMAFRFALFIIARLFESEHTFCGGFQGWLQKTCQPIPLKKKAGDGTPKAVLCIQPEGSRFNGEEIHLPRNLDDGLMARCIWATKFTRRVLDGKTGRVGWLVVGWLIGGFSHWVVCKCGTFADFFFFERILEFVELKFLFFVSI